MLIIEDNQTPQNSGCNQNPERNLSPFLTLKSKSKSKSIYFSSSSSSSYSSLFFFFFSFQIFHTLKQEPEQDSLRPGHNQKPISTLKRKRNTYHYSMETHYNDSRKPVFVRTAFLTLLRSLPLRVLPAPSNTEKEDI